MMIQKPVLPKEHGGWAILFIPLFMGATMAGTPGWNLLSFCLSVLFFFLVYAPVEIIRDEAVKGRWESKKIQTAKAWAIVYFSLGSLFLLPLLVIEERWLLVPVGIVGTGILALRMYLSRQVTKRMLADLLVIAGLVLTGPAAYYVQRNVLDRTAFLIWILNVLFFGCGAVYVHLKINAAAMKGRSLHWEHYLLMMRPLIAYLALAMALVGVLIVLWPLPWLVAVAFVPFLLHAVVGILRLSRRVSFKRLGFALLGHSIVFGILVVSTLSSVQ